MNSKRNFASRIGRLFQSSFLFGLAMALVISQSALMYHVYADACTDGCNAKKDKAISDAAAARQDAYGRCSNAYASAYNLCEQPYNTDARRCALTYAGTYASASTAFKVRSAYCVGFVVPKAVGACVLRATVLFAVAQAGAAAELTRCTLAARGVRQNCRDAAATARTNCRAEAENTYNKAVEKANANHAACIVGCGG